MTDTDKLQEAASGLADQAKRVAETKATTTKDKATEQLDSVAQAVRSTSDNLREERPEIAGLVETAADKVEQASSYLRQHELPEMIAAAEDLARRQPLLFLGGGLALGMLAARFLKSSSPSGGGSAQAMGGRYGGSGWGQAVPTGYGYDYAAGRPESPMAGTGYAGAYPGSAYAGGTTGSALTADAGATATGDFDDPTGGILTEVMDEGDSDTATDGSGKTGSKRTDAGA